VTDSESTELRQALERIEVELPDDRVDRLVDYCGILWEWNAKINLTRHTDLNTFAERDLLDAVQLAKLLKPDEEVLDVGTGGGAPGIVLAIIRPDLKIALSESVGKKADVLDDMVDRLGLPTPVYHERAETVVEHLRCDALTARAVGPLWKMCKWFEPHWHNIGRLLAIKGPRWTEERLEARHRGLMRKVQLRKAVSYPMPGTDSESVILKLWGKGLPEP
jgi:16S rRNA (guanine527-N7)-methyltransferase